jgi:hypothetical protein
MRMSLTRARARPPCDDETPRPITRSKAMDRRQGNCRGYSRQSHGSKRFWRGKPRRQRQAL